MRPGPADQRALKAKHAGTPNTRWAVVYRRVYRFAQPVGAVRRAGSHADLAQSVEQGWTIAGSVEN